jgi:hypothetical protein
MAPPVAAPAPPRDLRFYAGVGAAAFLIRFPLEVVLVGWWPLPTGAIRFLYFAGLPIIAFAIWCYQVRSVVRGLRHRRALIVLSVKPLRVTSSHRRAPCSALRSIAVWACALMAIVYIVDVPRNRPWRRRRS